MRGLDRGQRPALLISECQNAITNIAYADSPLANQVHERGIIDRINQLADAFRANRLPVIHCTIAVPSFDGFVVNCALAAQIKKQGRLIKGSRDAAIHDELVVHPGDIISERLHGMAAFSGTELEWILRGHGVQTVVFAGVSTNVALPGGATEAVARAFDVIVVEECTAGGTAESHQMQITQHLPLLATVTRTSDLLEELTSQSWASASGCTNAPSRIT
jgi:nicotinamidase-related amidase